MATIDAISSLNPYLAPVQPLKPQVSEQVDQTQVNSPKSVNPAFGQLTGGETRPPKAEYAGLAFSSNLQNVSAGEYKGKENILNQIAIA